MMPRFFVAKRPGWRGMFGTYRFCIVAEVDGTNKVVALTHEAEVGMMVAEGLNQWREMDAQLQKLRGKGPRIVTLT